MLLLLLFVVAIFIRTRINFTIQHPHSYLQTSETGGLQNIGGAGPMSHANTSLHIIQQLPPVSGAATQPLE